MYSKNKSISRGGYDLTPPPGYNGSRLFTRRERSDGRDENFVAHTRPIYRGRGKAEAADADTDTQYPEEYSSTPTQAICEEEQPAQYPAFPGVEAFLDEDDWDDPQPTDTESSCEEEQKAPERKEPPAERKGKSAGLSLPEPLAGILHGLEREDLLLIGLILLLSGDKDMHAGDILLLLALLLITK